MSVALSLVVVAFTHRYSGLSSYSTGRLPASLVSQTTTQGISCKSNLVPSDRSAEERHFDGCFVLETAHRTHAFEVLLSFSKGLPARIHFHHPFGKLQKLRRSANPDRSCSTADRYPGPQNRLRQAESVGDQCTKCFLRSPAGTVRICPPRPTHFTESGFQKPVLTLQLKLVLCLG